MKTLTWILVLAAAFSLSGPQSANGQATTASVVGLISDPSGAAIPNAVITIHNVQTNQNRTSKSNEVGNYEFSFLPIGDYTLSVEASGFQRAEVSRFQLNVDQVARINVPLNVGEVSEKVAVEATAVGLQTESTSVGAVI